MIDIIAYFAGAFGRKPELIEYMKEWHELGHFCSSAWLKNEHEVDFQDDLDALAYGGYGHQFALEDLDDIYRAECTVFFSSAGTDLKGKGGRHTEFGVNLGRSKPLILIGAAECAFHATVPDDLRFESWDEFIDDIKAENGTVQYHIGAYRTHMRKLTTYLG